MLHSRGTQIYCSVQNLNYDLIWKLKTQLQHLNKTCFKDQLGIETNNKNRRELSPPNLPPFQGLLYFASIRYAGCEQRLALVVLVWHAAVYTFCTDTSLEFVHLCKTKKIKINIDSIRYMYILYISSTHHQPLPPPPHCV